MMPSVLMLFPTVRIILGIAILSVMSTSGLAEVLSVRSGEHNGFSRIVVAPQQRTGWSLGRVGAGYELRLDRPGITFDLSRAFDLIPKQRLSALSAGTVDSSMAFGLACNCHAVAFETAGGAIVVDLVSGPANPASGFETRLDGQTRTEVAPGGLREDVRAPDRETHPGGGMTTINPSALAPTATGYVFDPAPFWGGRAPDTPGNLPASEQPALVLPDQAGPIDAPHTSAAAELATVPPPEAAPSEAEAIQTSSPTTTHMAISNTERDLLFQLSRAATQGLVTPRDVIKAPNDRPVVQDAAQDMPKPDPQAPPDDRAAVRSQTSVDRDTMAVFGTNPARNADGAECAPDDAIDIASWGDESDPVSQFVAARSQIVGEFDHPDEMAVVRLARVYLHFGFGAEARAALDAFDVPDAHAPYLREMGFLIDGDDSSHAASIATMSGCDSKIALWAALARREVEPGDLQTRAAIMRGFAGLPAVLRKTIGPRLADIFFLANDPDAARNIRNSTDLAAIEPDRAVNLIDARLDLRAGNKATAQEILDRLSRGDDATAQDALILGIEERLRDGKQVDPILTDTAAALARENRGTEKGGQLHRAYVLALAANGHYAQSFAELGDAKDIAPAIKREAAAAIFSRIADFASDTEYLAAMSSQIDRFLTAEPSTELQIKVAGRLQSAGLPDMALHAMDDRTSGSDAGRILRAKVGLDNFDPELALVILSGLEGADAITLRARAYDMAGMNAEAARAYAAAGNASDGADAAWRAGDWERAAALGDIPMQERLHALGLVSTRDPSGGISTPTMANGAPGTMPAPLTATGTATDSASPGDKPADRAGPLATARELISRSQDTRNVISDLLAKVP